MTSYINRNVTRLEKDKPGLTHEGFRSCFAHCPECGIVIDLRSGQPLSERDAQELEELMSNMHPPIPVGAECADCSTTSERRGPSAHDLHHPHHTELR